MVCRGTVHNGVVVLDSDVHLPDGATVSVQVIGQQQDEDGPQSTWAEVLQDFIGAIEGPPDLAARHDRYAHGAARSGDSEP